MSDHATERQATGSAQDNGAPLGAGWQPSGGFERPEPFAVLAQHFVQELDEDVLPLLGDVDEAVIPVGGLVLVAGKAGIGKTTFVLDCALHLVSGLEWLGLQCERPLRVLIVENEGPIREFRRKLRAKLDRWTHPLAGELFVKTYRWGAFSIAHSEDRELLRAFLEDEKIDLVVGDPLGTLGTTGVGSPEDTRGFVEHLVELGLTRDRTFLFLHHLRKEGAVDELDQVSGAWGGHLDTLLVLKPTQRSDEVRLSFPKLRWAASRDRRPLILGLIRATQSFEVLGEEGDTPMLERAIVELLEDGKWRTVTEIATKREGGVGVRERDVKACLDGNAHLFRTEPGNQHGRSAKATVWQLRPGSGGVGRSDAEGEWDDSSHPPHPVGVVGAESDSLTPPSPPSLELEDLDVP